MKGKFLKPVELNKSIDRARHASWLELFIDLGFVIAIASLETLFHHGINGEKMMVYLALFFTIMWVWNRLTWYSSYYGNDDWFFRIGFIVSLFFILGFSSSVARISVQNYAEALYWYLAIDCIILLLWFRVLFSSREFRLNTLAFFGSYLLAFILIVVSLLLPLPIAKWLWITALLMEMTGPMIGWKLTRGKIYVHTSHILERHGLFAIIILGEGLVSISRILAHSSSLENMFLAIMSMGVIALIWWIYFDNDYDEWTNLSKNIRRTFIYGYGQFFVFLSMVILIFSFEMNRYDQPNNAPFSSGQLKLGATGMFLLSLGLIQLLTSHYAHFKKYYFFKTACGIMLILLSLLSGLKQTNYVFGIILFILTTIILHRHDAFISKNFKTKIKMNYFRKK